MKLLGDETDFEVASKGFEEIARLHAQHSLVGVILTRFALVDLFDGDIGECGTVEKSGYGQIRMPDSLKRCK